MGKLTLAVPAVIIAAAAILNPSVVARVQTPVPRFEYLRMRAFQEPAARVPYGYRVAGYKACIAAEAGWNCRDFMAAPDAETAIGAALNTLGTEGWEVASAIPAAEEGPLQGAVTYLFKRARP